MKAFLVSIPLQQGDFMKLDSTSHFDVQNTKRGASPYMGVPNRCRFSMAGGDDVAEYRTVSVSFWHSPYIESLNTPERLLYLYLFTNHHVTNAGIMQVSRRAMAFETGIENIEPCIDRLQKDGKIMEVDGYFWVPGFIEHQTANSPKITVSIVKSLLKVPETLAMMVCERYPGLRVAYESACQKLAVRTGTISQPYQYGIDTVSIPYAELELEGEVEKEEEGSGKKKLPDSFHSSRFRDEAYAFADWFARELKPESLRKVTEKMRNEWALTWYQLRETDGRNTDADKEQLKSAITWARRDPFWSKNFMSPLKLRKKGPDGIMYIDRFIELCRASSSNPVNGARARQDAQQPGGRYELAKPLTMEA